MWKTVPCRSSHFQSGSKKSGGGRNTGAEVVDVERAAASPAESSLSSSTSVGPNRQLVKQIRRGSAQFASKGAANGVLEVLHEMARRFPSCTTLRLIGLGIGPLTSDASLVQTQFFLCLAESLHRQKYAVRVESMVYDPLLSEPDRLVFDALGITCDTRNMFGAYEMGNDTLQVAFMPHCPITLYRNLLAANWPTEQTPATSEESSGTSDISTPLERLIILGNDFGAYNVTPAEARKCNVARLLPIFDIGTLVACDSDGSPSDSRARQRRTDRAGALDDMKIVRTARDLTTLEISRFCAQISPKKPKINTTGPDILSK